MPATAKLGTQGRVVGHLEYHSVPAKAQGRLDWIESLIYGSFASVKRIPGIGKAKQGMDDRDGRWKG